MYKIYKRTFDDLTMTAQGETPEGKPASHTKGKDMRLLSIKIANDPLCGGILPQKVYEVVFRGAPRPFFVKTAARVREIVLKHDPPAIFWAEEKLKILKNSI